MSSALFGDDADEGEVELRVSVNKRYAKEYQSRKQREELRNAEQEEGSDSSSTSESEDEDGEFLSPSVDVSILKTIHALRSKDASIYDPSSRFFPDANEDDDEESDSPKEKKPVPKRFKDVIREQIVEQMEAEETADATEEAGREDNDNPLEYNQEQKALRAAFLESTQENDDEDDWMVLKKREKRDDVERDKLIEQELQALEQTTSSLKDPRGEVEDGDRFLLDFIKNKKWIDKNDQSSSDEDEGEKKEVIVDDDDSMDELEKADDFESKYNFRFEEAEAASGKSGADFSVVGYARSGTMNTLRRKDEARKNKREERKERKAAERKAKEEQLRRLKNAKREEMEAKLNQIRSVLGHVEERGKVVDEATIMKLMEGDYDPEKFERLMDDVYGDDFYEQEDAEWKTDTDVRETLLMDEDGQMIVGQDDAEGGLYDDEQGDDEEYGEDVETDDPDRYAEDYGEEDADANYEEETETEKKLREKMTDELYKLDYEDIIAGMPTRFKYRKVEPNSYGLSTEEILFARDTTLKNYVSLKKMAPYREDSEHHVGSKKRRRFRDLLKQDLEETLKEQAEEEKAHQIEVAAQGDDDDHKTKKKKKRRRQKKGKKQENKEHDEVTTRAVETSAEMKVQDKKQEPNSSTDHEHSKSKRKRKKKGEKIQNLEEAQAVSGTTTEEIGAVTNGDDKKSTKESKNRHAAKKRKKQKTVSVEGVPASRLASYNL
jgi:protein KRI1